MADRTLARILGLLAFAVPFALYALTAAPCVGFDDASEFAYVAAEWSVAHPPGFPVWVALAHLWTLLFSWLDLVRALHLLSAVFGAGAVLLVYAALARILTAIEPGRSPRRCTWAAFLAAMATAAGATVWQWSNAIEVYAFQGFCTALFLYAIALDPRQGRRRGFVLAGLAVGLGFANHSLTTLLLLPLAVVMAGSLWRADDPATGAKAFVPCRDRRLLLAAGTAVLVFVLSCAVMMLRARGQYAFEFDNPDTLRRLWHHLKGGFFGKGLFNEEAFFGSRVLFHLGIVLQHFWLSAVFLVAGMNALRRTRPVLAIAIAGYLVALIVVQSARTMVANTDCYLIPAFLCCALPVALGLVRLRERAALLLGLGAVLASALINFRACDRTGYDAGDAWIRDLDASAPQRSVILLQNWDQQMLLTFYRDHRGFRPDVVVLPGSIKGTNCECAARVHPQLLRALQPEYDAWLAAIRAVDPDYVFTDFFDTDTKSLADSYGALARKVFQVALAEDRTVLMDRTIRDYLIPAQVLKSEQVHPCGMLFSLGRLRDPPPFPMSGRWWHEPFLMYDLCAAAVLRDYQENARQMAGYWKAHGDAVRERQTADVSARIRAIAEAYRVGKPLGWKQRE